MGTFVRAASAGFAGFAVLGLFAAVAPSYWRLLGLHSLCSSGGVVFSVLPPGRSVGSYSSRFGKALLKVGCAGLVVGMALLTAGLAVESFELLVSGGLVAGLGRA